jgi:DNA repair protein RecO (recombination protein O)
MQKSYQVEAIVLKRTKYGETDRIVTLFTSEVGKIKVLARGVRKITSKRIGSLEVGTCLKAQVIHGRGMDILSQTVIVDSYSNLKSDLTGMTQLYLLLEVIDCLTGENQELPEIYTILANTLQQLSASENRKAILLKAFKQITLDLGFTPPQDFSELTLKNYIESISERKLKSKDFLNTKI